VRGDDRRTTTTAEEGAHDMPKGEQRNDKANKKPKKDTGAPRETSSDRPVAPVTAVMPKGKLKNKAG
jgi:hypothetical protein